MTAYVYWMGQEEADQLASAQGQEFLRHTKHSNTQHTNAGGADKLADPADVELLLGAHAKQTLIKQCNICTVRKQTITTPRWR